jgi:hypothetical protein
LTADVGKTNDLSEKYPDQLNGMIKDYDDYAKSVGIIPPV